MVTLVQRHHEAAVRALAHKVYAHEPARRYTGWTEREDVASLAEMWARRAANDWHIYEVFEGPERLGLAGLKPPGIDPGDPPGRAKVAVYLTVQRTGAGTAVTRELIDEARRLGADVVWAITQAANEAAVGLLEKLGFDPVGPSTCAWTQDSEQEWVEYELPLG